MFCHEMHRVLVSPAWCTTCRRSSDERPAQAMAPPSRRNVQLLRNKVFALTKIILSWEYFVPIKAPFLLAVVIHTSLILLCIATDQ